MTTWAQENQILHVTFQIFEEEDLDSPPKDIEPLFKVVRIMSSMDTPVTNCLVPTVDPNQIVPVLQTQTIVDEIVKRGLFVRQLALLEAVQ